MIKSLFIFAPCIVSMCAIAVLLMRYKKGYTDWWLLVMLLILVGYFISDAWFFTSDGTLRESIIIDMCVKMSLLTLLPTTVFWFRKKAMDENPRWFYFLIYLLPIAWCVVIVTLYHSLTNDALLEHNAFFLWSDMKPVFFATRTGKALYYVGQDGFRILLALESLVYVVFFVYQFVQLMKARPLKSHKKFILMIVIIMLVMAIVVGVRVAIGLFYLHDHPVVDTVFYILFAAAVVLCMYLDICDKLLGEHHRLMMAAAENQVETPGTDVAKFEKLMLVEEWCYQKGVSEDAVARELGTNRTYLANMIKVCYGQTFTGWVSECRIKYAQRLMLERPEARLVEIAETCGFADDSVFSRTFSKVTGMTPREWYLKNKI